MSASRWEYKTVFVDGWRRISIEGEESYPEEGERTSGFSRRFLNGLGADGWELVGIQHTRPGQSYYIFKRQLEDGAEPDLSVVRNGIVREQPGQRPGGPPDSAGPQAVTL